MTTYNYNTERSREVIERILRVLRANEEKGGTTQREIAAAISMSAGTVSRYVNHMVEQGLAFITAPTDTRHQRGSSAFYQPGRRRVNAPVARTRRKREYDDLPLSFFGVKT